MMREWSRSLIGEIVDVGLMVVQPVEADGSVREPDVGSEGLVFERPGVSGPNDGCGRQSGVVALCSGKTRRRKRTQQ